MSEPGLPSGHRPAAAAGSADLAGAHDGARAAPTDPNRHALVVVDDEPDDFILLNRALQRLRGDVYVCWAHNAAEALKMLARVEGEVRTVVVVSDIKLPGIDGFELLNLVKNRPTTSRVKFAFLTGRADRLTQDRAHNAGADAFFIKPNGTEELVEVARALHGLALNRE